MIRWCAWCQSFLGQVEPTNDFRITHSVCDSCVEKGLEVSMENLTEIQSFFDSLFGCAHEGVSIDPASVLDRAREMGVSPTDTLVGVIHPVLAKIGLYFEEGRISVEKEHLFCRAVEGILQLVPAISTNGQCDLLLVQSRHNTHSIGTRVVQYVLAEKCRLHAEIVSTPREKAELRTLIREYRPKAIGVSCALPEHVEYAGRVNDWLRDEPDTDLILGGAAFRGPDSSSWTGLDQVVHVSDATDVSSTVKTIRQMFESPDHVPPGRSQ